MLKIIEFCDTQPRLIGTTLKPNVVVSAYSGQEFFDCYEKLLDEVFSSTEEYVLFFRSGLKLNSGTLERIDSHIKAGETFVTYETSLCPCPDNRFVFLESPGMPSLCLLNTKKVTRPKGSGPLSIWALAISVLEDVKFVSEKSGDDAISYPNPYEAYREHTKLLNPKLYPDLPEDEWRDLMFTYLSETVSANLPVFSKYLEYLIPNLLCLRYRPLEAKLENQEFSELRDAFEKQVAVNWRLEKELAGQYKIVSALRESVK